MFAQRRNFANPKFLRMCRDILKFNAKAADHVTGPEMTIGELIKALRLGPYFRDYYLLPFSGAIWSTPTRKILDFPAYALISFFRNHGLMSHKGQHQWFTVDGGSVQYVSRLGLGMTHKGVKVRLGCPISAVRRTSDGVEIKAHGAEWERFDEVVFATHSDVTLRLLTDPSRHEQVALGAIRFQPNDVILHSDTSVMPKARKVWSSWCYAEGAQKSEDRIDVSYWMNSLQPWLRGEDMIVTLNTTRPVREELIWDQATFDHPVFDGPALQAQASLASMNGANRTWFCGAWMKNGFHEDGIASAIDVVEAIGGQPVLAVAAE